MKKLFAYISIFLFLLPSVGIHLDLTYCCGQLSNIDVVHEASQSVSSCCSIEPDSSCTTSVELVLPPQLLDVATANGLEYPTQEVVEIPYITAPTPTTVLSNKALIAETEPWLKPPSRALFQVFLC